MSSTIKRAICYALRKVHLRRNFAADRQSHRQVGRITWMPSNIQPLAPLLLYVTLPICAVHQMPANEFALTRVYQNNTPLHDPDAFGALVDSNDEPQHASIQDDEASLASIPAMEPKGALFPYPNRSSLELGDWWEKAPKSRDAFRDLVHIVGHPSFVPADIATTNWDSMTGLTTRAATGSLQKIKLQSPLQTGGRGSNVKEYTAGILHHRKLTLCHPGANHQIRNEHLRRRYGGLKLVWTPPEKPEGTRVYGEIYTSDEFLKAEKGRHEQRFFQRR
ncbi:hypothetical protein BKA70DRAFT_1416234 [Coprinopsis sp. MPI-PUGE-AT-0042]|nr:hypothetical protein BKA70DRAFT_1416234 [Coprinopsis sp. MPI-PUGE-AT-0042]